MPPSVHNSQHFPTKPPISVHPLEGKSRHVDEGHYSCSTHECDVQELVPCAHFQQEHTGIAESEEEEKQGVCVDVLKMLKGRTVSSKMKP